MDAADVVAQYMHIVTIHGREFQKYAIENNIYLLPVDEETGWYLDIMNDMFHLFMGDKLILPPINQIDHVLDLGFGTGGWAVQVAEEFPDAEVTGLDISGHLIPDEFPSNFIPLIADINRPIDLPSNHFDIVQSRTIGDGISKARWPTLVQDIARILKPGGWYQAIEWYNMVQSHNGRITDESALRRWSTRYMRSIDDLKDPRAQKDLDGILLGVGFTNVAIQMLEVPLSGWREDDERQKLVGEKMADIIERHLRTLSLLPFTRRTLMSIQDFDQLIRDAVAEARDPAIKAYLPLYVVLGQKPH